MEEIRCQNCGAVLVLDDVYDELYGDDYHTECCIYHCPQCEKDFQIELHYRYESYSIEEEI